MHTDDRSADAAPIPLAAVPKLTMIGPRRSEKRLHVRTVFRWALHGLHGIQLDTWLQGGQRYTSVAALQRFFAAVAAEKQRSSQAMSPGRARESDGRRPGRGRTRSPRFVND